MSSERLKFWANKLNGRQYGNEITEEEVGQLGNVVVVFGYSDDTMIVAVSSVFEDVPCFEGGSALFQIDGLVENKCDCEDCPYYDDIKEAAYEVKAVSDQAGYSWVYKTDIPHETFEIFDNNRKYCRGIVFSLDELELIK